MNKNNKKQIIVPPEAQFYIPSFYRRLWIADCNLGVPRRKFPDELSLAILHCRQPIIHQSSKTFTIPDLDKVLVGNDFDLRWLSNFRRADPTGILPLMECRKIERLVLLYLFYAIKHPLVAEQFFR